VPAAPVRLPDPARLERATTLTDCGLDAPLPGRRAVGGLIHETSRVRAGRINETTTARHAHDRGALARCEFVPIRSLGMGTKPLLTVETTDARRFTEMQTCGLREVRRGCPRGAGIRCIVAHHGRLNQAVRPVVGVEDLVVVLNAEGLEVVEEVVLVGG
jgi:hypothetical protein